MFWVELTNCEDGVAAVYNLEKLEAITPSEGGTWLRFNTWHARVEETPEEIETLLPFVRRVGEKPEVAPSSAWEELRDAAEEQVYLGGGTPRLRAALAAVQDEQEQKS